MATREIDCLTELCPIPILRAIKEFKTMEAEDILIIRADHSCVPIDLKKWANEKKYPIKAMEVGAGEWEVYIQKLKELKE